MNKCTECTMHLPNEEKCKHGVFQSTVGEDCVGFTPTKITKNYDCSKCVHAVPGEEFCKMANHQKSNSSICNQYLENTYGKKPSTDLDDRTKITKNYDCNQCIYDLDQEYCMKGFNTLHQNFTTCSYYNNGCNMTRPEAVNYLMKNPATEIERLIDTYGTEYTCTSVIHVDTEGSIKYREGNPTAFPIYIKNDKARFRVKRQLREMDFTEAYHLYIQDGVAMFDITNVNSGSVIKPSTKLKDLQGKWTVKGEY